MTKRVNNKRGKPGPSTRWNKCIKKVLYNHRLLNIRKRIKAILSANVKQAGDDQIYYVSGGYLEVQPDYPGFVPSGEPYVRTTRKIRRNEACPCGKRYERIFGTMAVMMPIKYKRCCGG